MEQFKTFEQCCQAKGYDPENCLPDVTKLPKQHQQSITALAKLMIIAESVNGDWKPNWNDRSEDKWIPWFDMEVDKNNPSGFRFDDSFSGRSISGSAGGSRLCFVSAKVCKFVGQHYEDLWRAAMVLTN